VEVEDEDCACQQKSYLPVNMLTSPSNRDDILCNRSGEK
jgi:hypothetical protein